MGVLTADRLPRLCLPALVLLLALGLACGRRGVIVAWLAIGLLLGGVQGIHSQGRRPDERHPVALVGRPIRGWVRVRGAWAMRMEVTTYRQTDRVRFWHAAVSIYAPGGPRPKSGSVVRVRGYLRRSAGYANQPATPPGPWRMSLKSLRFLQILEPRIDDGSRRLRRRLRSRVVSAVASTSESAGELVRVFALGDRHAVDTATVQGLRRLGLSHLLAVSGLHVGLVALLGLWLPLPRRGRELAALFGVMAYLWLVGGRPSLIRAVVMAWLAGGALLLGRLPAGLNALAWAALVMIGLDPTVVGDVGFQLSLTATAGILLFAGPLAARWTRLPRRLALPLAVTVSAQLAALPWSVAHFHYVPLLAPLANLIAVPWMGVVMGLCLVFASTAMLCPAAVEWLSPVLSLAARPLAWPAAVPATWTPILPVSWSALAGLVVAVAVLVSLWRARPRLLVVLGSVLLLAQSELFRADRGPELTVWDVGQGESILVRDGSHTALIDGGGWRHGDFGGRVLLPALAGTGIRRIEAMIMSHPDRDHCGGLVDLARYLPVEALYAAPQLAAPSCWDTLRRIPGMRPRALVAGETLRVGRWSLKVLGPVSRRLTGNDLSLVLRVTTQGWSALLPGDVEAAGEAELVRRWGRRGLAADLLLVPHHGSRTSSSDAFLDAVNPALAVVSAGWRNAYGHPAAIVLSRLGRHGIRVLRTDRDGMVRFRPRSGRVRIRIPTAPREPP